MQSIVKPKAFVIFSVVSTIFWVACVALNKWDAFGDTATPSAVLFMGIFTLGLGVGASSVVASKRVRDAILRKGVNSESVRVRFLVAAGVTLVLGAIECLVAIRRFS